MAKTSSSMAKGDGQDIIKHHHRGWPRHHQASPQGMAKTSSSMAKGDGQDIIKHHHRGWPRHHQASPQGMAKTSSSVATVDCRDTSSVTHCRLSLVFGMSCMLILPEYQYQKETAAVRICFRPAVTLCGVLYIRPVLLIITHDILYIYMIFIYLILLSFYSK